MQDVLQCFVKGLVMIAVVRCECFYFDYFKREKDLLIEHKFTLVGFYIYLMIVFHWFVRQMVFISRLLVEDTRAQ